MASLGVLDARAQELLRATFEAALKKLSDAWTASAAKREIFWINLWQGSVGGEPMDLGRASELDTWVRELVASCYDAREVDFDGYGFIINPIGSKTQPWHVDYTMGYSTIFIPLCRLTTHNCTQYAVLPPNVPDATRARIQSNLDVIDFDQLVEDCGPVSVRQLLAPPYSVIKMDFGTIHRGISNTGTYERTMFWISVIRKGHSLPVEPVVEVIHKT